MSNLQTIEDRIMYLANNMGLSKNKLLINAQLSKSIFDNMKRGQIPAIDKIETLAEYLDCSVDYLLGRTDDPQAHKTQNTYTIQNRNTTVSGTQANVITAQPIDKETLELAQLIQSLPLVKRAEAVLAVEKIRKGS